MQHDHDKLPDKNFSLLLCLSSLAGTLLDIFADNFLKFQNFHISRTLYSLSGFFLTMFCCVAMQRQQNAKGIIFQICQGYKGAEAYKG